MKIYLKLILEICYEDLNEETFTKMLINLKQSKQIKSGSQIGRISSEPMKFDN